tara:strand:+ start:487 stop:750 length:264 start_codon:yes stop_codon:yes gene_type:complete
MKKIKLTVASVLLSGICFAQTQDEKVIIERTDHLEVINTVEDMIGWIVEDVANGYITDTVIADTYIDNLEEILFKVKNRTILIENED